MTWSVAFLLTQLIEISAGVLVWRDKLTSFGRKILIIFSASLITHPFVWFVFPAVCERYALSYEIYLIIAESFAYFGEAIYYYTLRVKRPVLLSFFTNSCSFLTGLLLQS